MYIDENCFLPLKMREGYPIEANFLVLVPNRGFTPLFFFFNNNKQTKTKNETSWIKIVVRILFVVLCINIIIIIIKYEYRGETSLFLSSHDSKRIQTTQKTWVSNSHQKQLPRRRLKSSFKTQSSSRRKMSSTSPREFMTRIKETKNCATRFSSRCLE